jgi:hypothetical protein
MSQQTILLRKIQIAVAALALATASVVAIPAQPSSGASIAGGADHCKPGAFGWDKSPPCPSV